MAKAGARSATSQARPVRTAMTQEAASRIQSATARVNGGQVAPKSFAARATSAAATNAQAVSTAKK